MYIVAFRWWTESSVWLGNQYRWDDLCSIGYWRAFWGNKFKPRPLPNVRKAWHPSACLFKTFSKKTTVIHLSFQPYPFWIRARLSCRFDCSLNPTTLILCLNAVRNLITLNFTGLDLAQGLVLAWRIFCCNWCGSKETWTNHAHNFSRLDNGSTPLAPVGASLVDRLFPGFHTPESRSSKTKTPAWNFRCQILASFRWPRSSWGPRGFTR